MFQEFPNLVHMLPIVRHIVFLPNHLDVIQCFPFVDFPVNKIQIPGEVQSNQATQIVSYITDFQFFDVYIDIGFYKFIFNRREFVASQANHSGSNPGIRISPVGEQFYSHVFWLVAFVVYVYRMCLVF